MNVHVHVPFRQTGAAPDSLKSEEDVFHKLEMDLVRGLRRVFRKGRGVTLQQIGQIFSGSSVVPNVAGSKKRFNPYSTLPRKRKVNAYVSSQVLSVLHVDITTIDRLCTCTIDWYMYVLTFHGRVIIG